MQDNTQDLEKDLVINVRSPSLNETLTVTTMLNSTVLSLKQAIGPIHPHHPNAESQRIIYSGKLLQDNELLIDIIKKVDDEVTPTFHLVVKPSLQSFQSQSQQVPTVPQPNINITPPSTSIPLPEPMMNNLNHCYPSLQSNNNINVPAYPSVLPGGYQVVVINGQYYLAPVLVPSLPLPQFQQNTPLNSPVYHQQQYQPQPPVYQPQNQQQPQQQQEPVIQPFINALPPQNGGAAPALVRPANAQRAASIWLALKLVVILFMLCQGASIERIFIFHAIAFVFFLYQTGRLRFVIRRVRLEDINNRFRPNNVAQRAPPPVPTQTPQQQQNENRAEGASTSVNIDNNLTQRRQTDNGEGEASSSSSATEQPRTPPTFLDVCKRGAYTFLASLWPTYGQDPRTAAAFENDNEREGLEEF